MKRCFLCDGELKETDYNLRDSKNLRVLKCKKCSLEMLSDFKHIDSNFYEDGLMLSPKISPKSWLNKSKTDDVRRFDKLKGILKNKKILDFGCGAGGFVELADKISDACGVEKQKKMFDFMKKKNLKVYSDISELKNEKFDVITMFHVLEHLNNPQESINELKNLLNPKGKLIIEVPNTNDALLSLYGCKSFSDFTHWSCHLWGFNNKNLKKMLKNSGFKKVKIKKIQRYNFLNHIMWLFCHKPNGHKEFEAFYNPVFNYLYTLFLKLMSKTDTIVAVCYN